MRREEVGKREGGGRNEKKGGKKEVGSGGKRRNGVQPRSQNLHQRI